MRGIRISSVDTRSPPAGETGIDPRRTASGDDTHGVLIRRELERDRGSVERVHASAFPTEVEAHLAAALRAGGYALAALSLVAERTPSEASNATEAGGDGLGEVVGHVVCSRGAIAGRPALGLGPIGVHRDHQGNGVGAALMHAVIASADALDETCIALLGDPAFYGRFGFVASTLVGIDPPVPEWGGYFQVRTLAAWDGSIAGSFSYASPFDDV
jgi:putative acetyltransferase